MKTSELIQLGALVAIGYIAYQKFGQKKSPSLPSTSSIPYVPPVDFGITNPDDPTWGDSFVNQLISQATETSL